MEMHEMAHLNIACIGEAMLELSLSSLSDPARVGVAGDVLNTAIYLRRMMGGTSTVKFVSGLGNDDLSNEIAGFINSENVDCSGIARISGKLPGIYSIKTDGQGERSFQYWRSESAARKVFQSPNGMDFSSLDGADVVYASAITLSIIPPLVRNALFCWIDKFRAEGGIFVFDSNYRPALWESPETAKANIIRAWSLCDIALPSIDDEIAIFRDPDDRSVVKRFANYPKCSGALKRGELGPISLNGDMPEKLVFAQAQTVVDTTAAGDGFNAGYLSGILSGKSQAQSLQIGHNLASIVIGHSGAIVPRAAWDRYQL